MSDLDPETQARVEKRLRELRGYMKQNGFHGVMLNREQIADLLLAFDAGWRWSQAKTQVVGS